MLKEVAITDFSKSMIEREGMKPTHQGELLRLLVLVVGDGLRAL